MAVSDTLPRRMGALRRISRARAGALLILLPLAIAAADRAGDGRYLTATALLGAGLVALLTLGLRQPAPSLRAERPAALAAADLLDTLASLCPNNGTGDGRCAACMVICLDNFDTILEAHGRWRQIEALTHLTRRIRNRFPALSAPLPLSADTLVVIAPPPRGPGTATPGDLAARLQAVIAEPLQIDGARLHVTASIGFCAPDQAPARSERALLDAAQLAADEARRRAPGGLCVYSPTLSREQDMRGLQRDTLIAALARGEIRPYFQPQISADTGNVSGVEALARWHHPQRGLLAPGTFLPAIVRFDISERLAEVMLHEALAALVQWDRAGLRVPSVSVNFSAEALRNPWLPERIRWELDRHGLRPPRLTIEILETVVAAAENDLLLSNIAQLSSMGCGIDLDDFGTGHASIWTLRRFQVRRLKIDRYFVRRADVDPAQQQMLSAILSLAERLQLDTVAEGIETPGEHALLSQLGCGHLQGFGIARPMPFDEMGTWLAQHDTRELPGPQFGLPGCVTGRCSPGRNR